MTNRCRFPSLFAVATFRHYGQRILNAQIKRPFLTRKLSFWTNFEMWISKFADKKSENNEGCLYDHERSHSTVSLQFCCKSSSKTHNNDIRAWNWWLWNCLTCLLTKWSLMPGFRHILKPEKRHQSQTTFDICLFQLHQIVALVYTP